MSSLEIRRAIDGQTDNWTYTGDSGQDDNKHGGHATMNCTVYSMWPDKFGTTPCTTPGQGPFCQYGWIPAGEACQRSNCIIGTTPQLTQTSSAPSSSATLSLLGVCTVGYTNVDEGLVDENCTDGTSQSYTDPFGNSEPWYECTACPAI